MAEKDYYKILGISREASQDEIKKVFKHLARKYHPDVNQGNKESEDKFKEVNDTLGHPIGDKVLKSIADILRSNIRAADILCRYGGDEFGLLLPETNFQGAYVTAERVRIKVEKTNLATEEHPVFISLSCGISSLVEGGALGMDELVTQADVALYKAKKAGRNQISFYGRK